VHLRGADDARRILQPGDGAHVVVERHAQLGDGRRPFGELRRREQPLERVERRVQVRRPGARPAGVAQRIADLQKVPAHPRVALRPVLRRRRRRPRRDDAAHEVPRRLAERRLVVGARALLGDEPHEQLALEPRPRQGPARRPRLGQRLAEGRQARRRFVERAGPRVEGEQIERPAHDARPRVLRQHPLGPDAHQRRLRCRRVRAPRQPRVGGGEPVDHLVLEPREVRRAAALLPGRRLRRRARRRARRGRAGARDQPEQHPRRPGAPAAHSPITF
jgi:hypothetical protein